jgi:hypothetical protein
VARTGADPRMLKPDAMFAEAGLSPWKGRTPLEEAIAQ